MCQVLSNAQHSKEGFIKEQADLSAKIQEYKKNINQDKCPLPGSNQSLNGDGTQPIPRTSQKEIEAVMQSTSEGKVLKRECFLFTKIMDFVLLCTVLCVRVRSKFSNLLLRL